MQQKGVVTILGRWDAKAIKALELIVSGSDCCASSFQKRGIGDREVKAPKAAIGVLEIGAARVLSLWITAVGILCRIMFILARPLMELSISWPKTLSSTSASEAALMSREPEPQVGS